MRDLFYDNELTNILYRYLKEKDFDVYTNQSPDLIVKREGKVVRIEVERSVRDYHHPPNYCDEIWAQDTHGLTKYKSIKVCKIPESLLILDNVRRMAERVTFEVECKIMKILEEREEYDSHFLNKFPEITTQIRGMLDGFEERGG